MEPLRDAPRQTVPTPASLLALPPVIPEQSEPFRIPTTLDGLLSVLLAPLEKQPPLREAPRFPRDTKSAHPFHGGSREGHRRIEHLISTGCMTDYKSTRNGLLGMDYSTKLSGWLALGCITARQIHFKLIDLEDGRQPAWKGTPGYGKGENEDTAAVRIELLWRDYMRLCTRKFGARLFNITGFRDDTSLSWRPLSEPGVPEILERFLKGTTGMGLIDASQRELYLTGYTSNRARQNVASFLTKHLGLDWKLGAEWYECMLVDYDVSSNWGNWQYVAGVGNDPRGEARVFNPIKQAVEYDPDGEFVKAWIEELRDVDDPQVVFQAWKLSADEKKRLGLRGVDWVEQPLKKIDFKVGPGKHGGGGGGGGKYGGSSRGKPAGAGEAPRGRGGGWGKIGTRGSSSGSRGRGRGQEGRAVGLDRSHQQVRIHVNGNGSGTGVTIGVGVNA